jgi:CubicO group peptidase (beta-lactamase class C family)
MQIHWDKMIRSEMTRQAIPGLNLLICQAGKTLVQQSYGFANLEHQVPVQPDTIFQIGSIGKQFAATAALQLIAAKKLELDSSLTTYLEEAPPSWQGITVRHLLNHTSGIVSEALCQTDNDLRLDFSDTQMLQRIAAVPLEFPAGQKFSYSNDAYKVLGILLSRVAGMFYGDFIVQEIFAPLNMKTAQIINDAAIILHRAAGYQLESGVIKNQTWVSPTMNSTADGAIYMTLEDFRIWDMALTEQKLLSATQLEQMWTATRMTDGTTVSTVNYGFGWRVHIKDGLYAVDHSGEWQGFTAHYLRLLEAQTSIIILTNLAIANLDPMIDAIAADFEPRWVKQ